MRDFEGLNLNEEVLRAVRDLEWRSPTPIQASAIPLIMAGEDVIGQAQTGTGKTGAFSIPLIQMMRTGGGIQGLVVVPTRELAQQVSEDFDALAKHAGQRSAAIYGGQSIGIQRKRIKEGVEIAVGTPGRLMDLMRQRILKLDGVRTVVLDEADRMLDMGFIEDISWILERTPRDRQTLLFSATIPPEIRGLAQKYMRSPKEVIVSHDELVVPQTEQVYYNVGRKNKLWLMCQILDRESPERALVFCQTKRMVRILAKRLRAYGYAVDEMHGDLRQNVRDKVLRRFKQGKIRILVASDVAARGLDIQDISHVINYDVPQDIEAYVHRIGRTSRMGKEGKAITFVTRVEMEQVRKIEDFARTSIEVEELPEARKEDTVRKVMDWEQEADPFGMVTFRINFGRRDGMKKLDLLNHISRKSRISEIDIGDIDVEEDHSLIQIHKGVAGRVVQVMNSSSIGAKKIEFEVESALTSS
jgi:ATP-dependent RNA helicase DeaD